MGGIKLKEIILRYIEYMKEKHKVTAAMVTGSYVTGEMSAHSDIDIFFIWTEEFKAMRGREYFEGVEFEYFISPEWKYYDRLRTDRTSMRIYSSSIILLDTEKRLEKIQNTAFTKVKEYKIELNVDVRKDYKFWLATICSDGEDLLDKGQYSSFLFFSGANLQMMSDLICKLYSKLPTYHKYGVKEITEIDHTYGEKLEKFLLCNYEDNKKKILWVELCNYIQEKLGDYDITNYENIELL